MINTNKPHFKTLRIYIASGQIIGGATLWQRLFAKNLGNLILKRAKDSNIRQAIMFPVKAGFLKDSQLVFTSTEVVLPKLPCCIELLDEPLKLDMFLEQNQDLLKEVIVVLENPDTSQIIYQTN